MHAPAPGPTVLCRGARLRPRSDRDSPPFLPPSPPSPFLLAILSSSPKVRLETLWRRSTAPRARATSVLTHATPSSSRGNPPARAPYSRPIPEATRGRKRQSEHSVHARTARWRATQRPTRTSMRARNPRSAHTPRATRPPHTLRMPTGFLYASAPPSVPMSTAPPSVAMLVSRALTSRDGTGKMLGVHGSSSCQLL
jgi:hypothetical protein